MNEFSKEITTFHIIGLYGEPYEYSTVNDAIAGIDGIKQQSEEAGKPLQSISVTVIYNNEETIHGSFKTNDRAKRFLSQVFNSN